jgi:hypothetical protein
MTGAATATLWSAGLLCVAAFTAWRLIKAVRRHHRHHRCANKRFMAGYRAGYRAARPQDRQTTARPAINAEQCLPVIRPRLPAAAGNARPLVVAGNLRGRHARMSAPILIKMYLRGIRTVHEDDTRPPCDYIPPPTKPRAGAVVVATSPAPPGPRPVWSPSAARAGDQLRRESRCA